MRINFGALATAMAISVVGGLHAVLGAGHTDAKSIGTAVVGSAVTGAMAWALPTLKSAAGSSPVASFLSSLLPSTASVPTDTPATIPAAPAVVPIPVAAAAAPAPVATSVPTPPPDAAAFAALKAYAESQGLGALIKEVA